MQFSTTSVKLKDLACVKCHGDAIRVVSGIERYLYLRCDCCGEVSTMTERRGVWRHSLPSQSAPLKAALRRATDVPEVSSNSAPSST